MDQTTRERRRTQIRRDWVVQNRDVDCGTEKRVSTAGSTRLLVPGESLLRGNVLRPSVRSFPPNLECSIEALRRLLVAWLARSDVPTLDPGALSENPTMPQGVRLAGRFLEHLIDPRAVLGASADSEELVAALEAAARDIASEVDRPQVFGRLVAASAAVERAVDAADAVEGMWAAFFPDAVGLSGAWSEAIAALRNERSLSSVVANPEPIAPSEVLLTSNVLLAPPLGDGEGLPFDELAATHRAASESQQSWYDHPISIDSPSDRHEAVYGLSALDRAVGFERDRRVLDDPVPVVLSVSTTHAGLDEVAACHVRRVLSGVALANLELYAFTESDARRLVVDVLGPALDRLGRTGEGAARVFGVAGTYGRHYSFLKAISALWNVLVDDRIRGTFKIDLDQVFPQEQLVAETGMSAFEHIAFPLWGGTALDSAGIPVSLEFIAGSLVNVGDVEAGLHTPDVVNPGAPRRAEDLIFFGALPQAVSTEAEMLPGPDGGTRQRVHVTGGTTGATVAGMRRARPFSPSFWGRAEDQAFGLSVWSNERRPVSVHVPGLVMRHDKDAFAADAVAIAAIDKLIGDHERTLMFSALGRMIDPDLQSIKAELGPFTGAFISQIPVTLAFVRLAVTTLSWAQDGREDAAHRLFVDGLRRCDRARRFAASGFVAEVEADRLGWDDFYDALDVLERALEKGEAWALGAREEARRIVAETGISTR